MPAELRELIEKTAKNNRRSLNAEILNRLESTFAEYPAPSKKGQVEENNKIYIVKPGQKNKPEPYTKKGVDRVALRFAIEEGEKYIEEIKQHLDPEKKAILFDLLYDLIEEDEEQIKLNNIVLKKLLELAS